MAAVQGRLPVRGLREDQGGEAQVEDEGRHGHARPRLERGVRVLDGGGGGGGRGDRRA